MYYKFSNNAGSQIVAVNTGVHGPILTLDILHVVLQSAH